MRNMLRLVVVSALISATHAWAPHGAVPQQRRSPTILSIGSSAAADGKSKPKAQQAKANKFAQPAFRQPAFAQQQRGRFSQGNQTATATARTTDTITEESLPKKHKIRTFGADSVLAEKHERRVKTAGRVGTKRYVNPCKVFVGNLPFDCAAENLQTWLCNEMGLPRGVLLNECNVVCDWKTGVSKGFGFAVFTEAVYATVCIDKCHGADFGGRAVTVKQGIKKQSTELYVKKEKKLPTDAEEQAIQAGMQQTMERLDPYEEAVLRRKDPDLLEDKLDDKILFGEDHDGDDDDEDVDGVWMEDDDNAPALSDAEAMNRKTRREAARRVKRRKLPSNGFGTPAKK